MAAVSAAAALAVRIEALAGALRDAGVPPERAAALLARAADLAMSAVVLEALIEPKPQPRRRQPPTDETAVPLAA